MTVISDFSNPIEKDIFFELADYISSSKVGLEKESLRVLNTSISQHPHPELLGSALCNSYIKIK